MKRKNHSLIGRQTRQGVLSAALLASMIIAGGSASAQQYYSSDTVIGNPSSLPDTLVIVGNDAHLTPAVGGGVLEAGYGYILGSGFIDRVSLNDGEIYNVNLGVWEYKPANLLKDTNGIVKLTGQSLYSGVTTIAAGTLQLGDGTNPGDLVNTSGVTIQSGGTLLINYGVGNGFSQIGVSNTITNDGTFEVTSSAGRTKITNITVNGAGEFDVTGGGTTVVNAGTVIHANRTNINAGILEVAAGGTLFGGNIHVGEGSTSAQFNVINGASAGNVSLDVDKSGMTVSDDGIHTGNVTSTKNNNEVTVNTGGKITGNVSLTSGTVVVKGTSSSTTHRSTIDGTVYVTTGNVDVVDQGSITKQITVGTGNVTVDKGSWADAISVTTGKVTIDNGSFAQGISITTGNATIDRASEVQGITVTTGDVIVDHGSAAHNKITVTTGDVTIDNGSAALNGISVTKGDVLIDRGSNALKGISLTTGNVKINRGSLATGAINVATGNIEVLAKSTLLDAYAYVNNGHILINDSTVSWDEIGPRSTLGAQNGYIVISGSSNVVADLSVVGSSRLDNIAVSISGSSNVSGNTTITNGHAIVDGASHVVGDITITEAGVVGIYNKSTVEGNIDIENGHLGIQGSSSLFGSADIHIGNIGVYDKSSIIGGANDHLSIDIGNIYARGASSIATGEINITTGNLDVAEKSTVFARDIDLTTGHVIADASTIGSRSISVGEGNVAADHNADISTRRSIEVGLGNVVANNTSRISAGRNIEVSTGSVVADGTSRISARRDIQVGVGNVVASNDSRISARRDIEVNIGSVVADGSRISARRDIQVQKGDIAADNTSRIFAGRNIEISEGTVAADRKSRITALEDIEVGVGDVFANNESHIVSVNGSIRVDKGDVIASNTSSVTARWALNVTEGDILAIDNSSISARYVYSGSGNITVLNNSGIDSHRMTINDGVLTVDETSYISGHVHVNRDAIADIEGIVDGDIHLRGGNNDQTGGTLIGNATITGNLINDGWLTPGRSSAQVGTVRVEGNFEQRQYGSYSADIFSKKSHDQVLVGGTAFINGGDLYIDKHNYKAYRNDKIDLVKADEGVVVNKAYNVHDNFAKNTMLEAHVRYTDDAVQLQIDQLKFAPRGRNENQRSVGRALDYAANRDQLDPLFDHLNYTDRGNVPELLARLSPEALTTIFNVGFANTQIQTVNIERRLDDLRDGVKGFSARGLALSDSRGSISFDGPIANERDGLSLAGFDGKSIVGKKQVAPLIVEQNRWGFFITGSGEWADVKSTFESQGGDFTSGGVTVGADYRVCDNLVVGINGSYVNTKVDLQYGGDIRANGGRGGLYASYYQGGAYLNAIANGGYNSYKIKRSTLGGDARGNTNGGQFDGLIGGGYDFGLGCFTVGPVASVQYAYVGFNEFNENGSDARLNVRENSQDSLRSALGAKASTAWNVCGMVLRPEVRAQWKHEFLDTRGAIDSSFTGSGALFTVRGTEVGRDSLVVDAGATLDVNATVSVFAFYTGELARTNYSSNSVNGGFSLRF